MVEQISRRPIRSYVLRTGRMTAAQQEALAQHWARWGLDLPGGDFATEIAVPDGCRGPCHLRLLVADDNAHGLGAANIYVRPATTHRSASPTERQAVHEVPLER